MAVESVAQTHMRRREQLTSVWTPDASETAAGPDSEPNTESRSERNLQHTHTETEDQYHTLSFIISVSCCDVM